MTVYLFSLSYEIGQIICDHLTSNNYSCFLFQTKEDLFDSLRNLKKLPSLLVLDYTIFNHDFFNIYTHLSSIKMELPVIFFNDPCIMTSTRTRHWLFQLEILCYRAPGKVLTDTDLEEYRKLFSTIEEIIALNELTPYISLLQKPQPLPDKLRKKTITIDYIRENNTSYIEDFKKRSKLPNNLFYLLQIFQKNSNIPLKLKEIVDFYEEDGKHITENSLKVLISKLRKEIRNDEQCKFIISNYQGAYSFIEVSKS